VKPVSWEKANYSKKKEVEKKGEGLVVSNQSGEFHPMKPSSLGEEWTSKAERKQSSS